MAKRLIFCSVFLLSIVVHLSLKAHDARPIQKISSQQAEKMLNEFPACVIKNESFRARLESIIFGAAAAFKAYSLGPQLNTLIEESAWASLDPIKICINQACSAYSIVMPSDVYISASIMLGLAVMSGCLWAKADDLKEKANTFALIQIEKNC